MPVLEASIAIDAPLQSIWEILLDRIQSPERYMAGVDACTFPEDTPEYAIREVSIGEMLLREQIRVNEREGSISYELVENELFTGFVYNRLIPPATDDPRATPMVQFEMNWHPINIDAETVEIEIKPIMIESLQESLAYIKALAEHKL